MKIYHIANNYLSEYEHLMSMPFEDLIGQYPLDMCEEMLKAIQLDIDNSSSGPSLMTRLECKQTSKNPVEVHEEKVNHLHENLRIVQDRISVLKGL